MSAWFKKKNKDKGLISDVPCCHIWKDFPWYVDITYKSNYDGSLFGTLTVTINEPYVCAACKARNDVELVKINKMNVEHVNAMQTAKDLVANYIDRIQPRAIIEDMVNDYIYVDKEKLEILEKLRGLGKG